METYFERIQNIEKMMRVEKDPEKRENHMAVMKQILSELEQIAHRTSPIIHSMQTEAEI